MTLTPQQIRLGIWLAVLLIATGIGLRIHQNNQREERYWDSRANDNAQGMYAPGWGSGRRWQLQVEKDEN